MTKKTATRPGVVPQGKGMTPKQLRFVDEYLIDMNATQAAIRAGYSKRTAGAIGVENLTKPLIAAALESRRKQLAVSRGITRERILDEMAKLAFSDLRQLFDENGRLLHPTQWPDGAAGAVSSLEIVEEFERDDNGGRKQIGFTNKLKLWDKGKQLDGLLKHLGLDQDKPPEASVTTVQLPQLAAALAKAAKLLAAS